MRYGIPETEQLYLQTPSPRLTGKVLSLEFAEAGTIVILDQTPFFPKCGGQPSDEGILASDRGVAEVLKVWKEGVHLLHLTHPSDLFSIGDVVSAEINSDLRWLHSRVHSAGELICAAISESFCHWTVFGALHIPTGASVTFDTGGDEPDPSSVLAAVEEKLAAYLIADFKVSTLSTTDKVLAASLCKIPIVKLPPGESIRLVNPKPGFFRPCVGTHVGMTSQIGRIEIKGTKRTKGHQKISYRVA